MKYSKLILTLSLAGLSGCSVFMAATSQEPPNLSVLEAGTPRLALERELGRPITDFKTNTGSIATFQYFTNDPANYRRAATYAVLDGITVGFAELITFPAEAVQGDRHVVTVWFDHSGKVISSRTSSHAAPIPYPEKMVGLEEELRPNDFYQDSREATLLKLQKAKNAR